MERQMNNELRSRLWEAIEDYASEQHTARLDVAGLMDGKALLASENRVNEALDALLAAAAAAASDEKEMLQNGEKTRSAMVESDHNRRG